MASKLDRTNGVPVVMRSRTTTTTTHYADGRTVTRRTSVRETMQGSTALSPAAMRRIEKRRYAEESQRQRTYS